MSTKQILRKILVTFFGYPLYILSFFFIRNRNRIAVGCHTSFSDNSKYFFLSSKNYLSDYEVVWITNNNKTKAHIEELGLKVLKIQSIKGLYYALTAKFYVYSFHLIDINFWTSGGATKINLWHGIPLKDIAFQIKEGPSAKIYDEKSISSRLFRPHVFVRPDFMLTTSSKMSDYFSSAFRITKKQCLEYGMPRCDILQWKKEEIVKFTNTYESEGTQEIINEISSKYDKTIIYMPTWREKVDFLNDAQFNFEELNDSMKKMNNLFIFKLHSFTKLKDISLKSIDSYSNLKVLDNQMDLYPILPFTDCLITDYSSVYYDYLLLKKPIYLYPYDYLEYKEGSRNLAFDYEKSMPAPRLSSFSELVTTLKNLDQSNETQKEQNRIKTEYFEKQSKNSCKKLSEHIISLNQNNPRLGYLMSFSLSIIKLLNSLIPKSSNKFLFISRPDYSDNTKHMYSYMKKQDLNKELAWLIYDKSAYDILCKNGHDNIYYLKTISGLWQYARSKTIITSSSSLWQVKSPFQKQFDLWHGIPLKTVLCMGESGVNTRRQAPNITMRFATSTLSKALLSASFDYNAKNIRITGQPRTDALYKKNNKLTNVIGENIESYKKIIIFMPTYRSGYRGKAEGNSFSNENIFRMTSYDHDKFLDFLKKHQILFLLKLHPYEENLYKDVPLGGNIKWLTNTNLIDKDTDIYDLLPEVDILITDYSSIFFDFLLLDKKIVFLPLDISEYNEKRGFQLNPYDFWAPGVKVFNQEALQKEILKEDAPEYKTQRKIVRDIMFKNQDDGSSSRVFNKMMD